MSKLNETTPPTAAEALAAAAGLESAPAAVAAAEGRAPIAPHDPAAPKKKLSLAELDATFGSEEAVPFEPLMPDGTGSGVILFVRSEQAPSVERGIIELINERRREMQLLDAQAAKARPGEVFSKIQGETLHIRKLTALRIAGWDRETIEEEPTEENKLRLLKRIPSWGEQIIAKGRELASFTPASPKT